MQGVGEVVAGHGRGWWCLVMLVMLLLLRAAAAAAVAVVVALDGLLRRCGGPCVDCGWDGGWVVVVRVGQGGLPRRYALLASGRGVGCLWAVGVGWWLGLCGGGGRQRWW